MSSQDLPSAGTNQGPSTTNRGSAPVPATGRLMAAAVTQDIVYLKKHMKSAEDRADEQELTIRALQDRDEQARGEEEERSLRIECLEAQQKQLKAQMGVVFQALGIDIGNLSTNQAITPNTGAAMASTSANPTLVGGSVGGGPRVKTESSSMTQDPSQDIRVSARAQTEYEYSRYL